MHSLKLQVSKTLDNMRKAKKYNYRVFVEDFASLYEYQRIINARPTNSTFANGPLTSIEGSFEYSHSHSYEEADALLSHGYVDGCNELTKIDGLYDLANNHAKNMPVIDTVGYTPHIPNTILGLPKSMINKRPREHQQKVISLIYINTFSGHVPSKDVIIAGRKIISLIHSLELANIRVNLFMIAGSATKNEAIIANVKIKDARQPLNVLKAAYPLVHPSILRRHYLRYVETHPNIMSDTWVSSYGKPIFWTFDKKDLENLGLLSNTDIMFTTLECIDVSIGEIVQKVLNS